MSGTVRLLSRRRGVRFVGVAVVIALVATCGLWFGRLIFDTQWTLTLHELLEYTGQRTLL